MEEKIPPHNLDAEQSLLGSMMISKDAVAFVATKINEAYFYRSAHGHIFKAILTLFKKNEPVDLVTVSNQLKQDGLLEDAGGRIYLADLIDVVPTAANIQHYGKIVMDTALARRLIDMGTQMIGNGFDVTQDVESSLDKAQRDILTLSSDLVPEDFAKLDTVLKDVYDSILSVSDDNDGVLGVSSGFADLDAITSGFQPADLVILAARPAMGKTTLALNFAVNAAVTRNIPVAIFSLEMPKEQLALRFLSSESKLDSKRLRTAKLMDHEYKNLVQAVGTLSEAPIFIDDTAGLTPLELRAKTRRLQVEADIKLIIIDYIQLMKVGRNRIESRFQEISEIIREVKGFAKESGIPIIALSQLSRDIEKRPDKRPMLSDLRESGELEQTADLVLFLHRDDYYNGGDANAEISTPANAVSITDLFIAKHRNGPTGVIKLGFKKDIAKFVGVDTKKGLPQRLTAPSPATIY